METAEEHVRAALVHLKKALFILGPNCDVVCVKAEGLVEGARLSLFKASGLLKDAE